jgi:hypothetical protein
VGGGCAGGFVPGSDWVGYRARHAMIRVVLVEFAAVGKQLCGVWKTPDTQSCLCNDISYPKPKYPFSCTNVRIHCSQTES